MNQPSHHIQHWSLIAIVVVSIAVNTPYFLPSYYPVHDTLSVFQFFSYYYSHILLLNELPWWLPATSYGMPLDSYILFSLGPFQYLAIGMGHLFNIKDSLFLFSLSLVGDTLFFAFGSYLFCRHILQDRLVAAICVVSILLLVQYDRQIYWNFKILLPLPLCLYLAQRGTEDLNPAYLLLSIAALLSWTFGSIPYVLPVQFYVVVFYCGILVLLKLNLRHLSSANFALLITRLINQLKQRSTLLLSLAAILVISICAYIMYDIRSVMVGQLAYNAIGRNTDLGVGLDYYLTYGGNTGYEKVFELFNGLPTSNPHDFLAFVGLVNLIFVANGFFSLRKSDSQIALAIIAIMIIAFTIAETGVAKAAYPLPGMDMVRHIGYFITIGKLLLLVLSGFGIRAYLRNN